MTILPKKNWIGKHLADMSEIHICDLFYEIANYKATGILEGNLLKKLAKDFSENVSHTNYGECLRFVEERVLFEMSRRYYAEHICTE